MVRAPARCDRVASWRAGACRRHQSFSLEAVRQVDGARWLCLRGRDSPHLHRQVLEDAAARAVSGLEVEGCLAKTRKQIFDAKTQRRKEKPIETMKRHTNAWCLHACEVEQWNRQENESPLFTRPCFSLRLCAFASTVYRAPLCRRFFKL